MNCKVFYCFISGVCGGYERIVPGTSSNCSLYMLSDVVIIGPGFSQEQDRRYTDLPRGWWVQKIYTWTSLYIYVIRFDLVHLDSANLDAQLGRRAQTKTTEIAISIMRSIRAYSQ